MATDRPTCRHCQKCAVNRPRGLCWSGYYTPGVRELYPSTSKYAHRGVGNITGVQPLPCEPTDTEPGSEARLAVLDERARLKQSLFHPDDRKLATSDEMVSSLIETKRPGFHHRVRKAIIDEGD